MLWRVAATDPAAASRVGMIMYHYIRACRYYSDKWSKKQTVGLLNIDKTPVIKEYGFRGSSACCRGMLQFFYLGYIIGACLPFLVCVYSVLGLRAITMSRTRRYGTGFICKRSAELEDAVVSMDDYYPHISSLLEFSLIRGRDGLGGLADYLINLLCQKGLMDASAALQRLDLAVKVAASVGPDVRVQVCSHLSFHAAAPWSGPAIQPITKMQR